MNRQKRFLEIFRFREDIRGHDNDYAETNSKLWRLLTDFQGTETSIWVFLYSQ